MLMVGLAMARGAVSFWVLAFLLHVGVRDTSVGPRFLVPICVAGYSVYTLGLL